MPPESSRAFAPGRVNLIGEHTDYNEGLALPFAIAEGVIVRAEAQPSGSAGAARIDACASDLGEHDGFALAQPPRPASGWRAFVRGTVAELRDAGYPLLGARVTIDGQVPVGAGLSSSAALEVALCLALIALCGEPPPAGEVEQIALARLCARVENRWAGAQTGLLDQLASLCGAPDTALCIDFRTLNVERVPLALSGWRLVVLDSGQRHELSSSHYNERRAECAQACRLLDVRSLREAGAEAVERLPEPLRARATHVIGENQRVREAVTALRAGDMPAVAALLNASHESQRDLYEVSTDAVESTRERLLAAGASGARLIGGGFGGSVLGLLGPSVSPPAGAREVCPGPGAHLLQESPAPAAEV